MNHEHLMNTEDIYYVKRLRMLSWMLDHGFTKYEVVPDPTSKKDYNWFVFKRTPEFNKAVEDYFAQL